MGVVPAGVHDARTLTAIVDGLGVLDAQRVNIGPHGNPPRACAAGVVGGVGQHAATVGSDADLEPRLVEQAVQIQARFAFVAAGLGISVQAAADCDHLRIDFVDGRVKLFRPVGNHLSILSAAAPMGHGANADYATVACFRLRFAGRDLLLGKP